MNLNDPFGRRARRDEAEYQALRTALKNERVDSRAKVDAVMARIRSRCFGTVAVAAAVTLLLVLLLPEFRVVAIVIGIAFVLWVGKTLVSGRRHVQRYVDEELG